MARMKNYQASRGRAAQVVATAPTHERPTPGADDAYIDMVAQLGPGARFVSGIRVLDLRPWLGCGIDTWVRTSGYFLPGTIRVRAPKHRNKKMHSSAGRAARTGQTIRALEALERYAQPLQARLADEARWLEGLLTQEPDGAGKLGNGMTQAQTVHRLNHVRTIGQHLVLGRNARAFDHIGSRVEVLSGSSCYQQLQVLAKAAGVDWALANHQCRRTFAYNVANSRLGRMGLVFLKWQLKHASMSWTQLYAATPYQDCTLYREFEEEMFAARLGLLEGWAQLDAPLSGGAGKKIMQTRARAARDLAQLLRQTAESVDLRSTGHAWCISGTRGCHGQGVYDPSMCAPCSQSIIDQELAPTWQLIHLDNLRLAALTDCGPAVAEKARRSVERSKQVLHDLGVPMPTDEQAQAYTAVQQFR